MTEILNLIMATAAIAIGINLLLRWAELPSLIGYILAGALITLLFGLENGSNPLLSQVAEFGLVFLMFNIGLEFSVRQLWAMRREVLGHGLVQVMATAGLFTAIGHWGFQLPLKSAIIIGSALALSSTAAVLKIFNERGEMDRPHARQALGILLFQDMAVIPIMLMIRFFTDTGGSLPVLLLETLASALVALGALYLVTRFIITRFLNLVSDTRSQEMFVAAILLIVTATASFTHAMGFSFSLGAFFAALMISETKFKYQIEADLNPFRDLLLGVFFVSVGMQIDPLFLLHNLGWVVLLMVTVMVLKTLLVWGILVLSQGGRTALQAGIAISQGGGFTFAVLELARGMGFIGGELAQLLILATVFSILVTPLLLKKLDRLADLLGARDRRTLQRAGAGGARRNHVVVCGFDQCIQHHVEEGHVVVCGYGELGQAIVARLRELELPYVAIDQDRQRVGEGVARGDAVIFGNAAQRTILEKAWVAAAGSVIITVEEPHKMRLIAEAVAAMVAEPVMVVKVEDREHESLLEGVPVKSFIHQHEEVARLLIDHALTCEISTGAAFAERLAAVPVPANRPLWDA